MCLDSSTNEADRLQNELFRFIAEDLPGFDATQALPELRQLMEFRASAIELMADTGWRLVETAKGSAADMVGMDFIFINLHDDSYFFIDCTLDVAVKASLPFMRTESVFRITTNEDNRVDVATKQRFCELLLDLMSMDAVLSVKETPPPNYTASLSFLEIANQIESFRKQLDAWVARLQREIVQEEAPSILIREAEIIHEYSVHLARALAFAKGEHERTTDQQYKAKVEHFSGCMRSALFDSMRAYLGLRTNQARSGDTQKTHLVSYDKRLDQLTLSVTGCDTHYKLYRVTSLVESVLKKVCENTKGAGPDYWSLKRQLGHEPARLKVIAEAITIIHSTKIHSVLGIPAVVTLTKTAQRKLRKKEKARQEGEGTKAA